MLEAIKVVLIVLGAYTVVGIALSACTYFWGNRSGNSGRFKHWSEDD